MNETEHKPQYWLVGAAYGGQDHQDEKFVEGGYWMLGWEEGKQTEKAKQINVGDRIAIKRMMGSGSSTIRIKHIGIVKATVLDAGKVLCTVDWCVTGLDRVCESRGCFGSIHGPYPADDWTRTIFSL